MTAEIATSSLQAFMPSPLGLITLVEEDGRLTRMRWGEPMEMTSP